MKEIDDFVEQFNAKVVLDDGCIVKKYNRYYLINQKLQKDVPQNFFYAGAYLGAVKGTGFFPSFLLLELIAKGKANKIVVDKKTAWLFICGRDIFKQGILKGDDLPKDTYTLVMNESNECLGFGRMVGSINDFDAESVFVKNILDLGDFLRRERHQNEKQSSYQDGDDRCSESGKRFRNHNR
ncbi:MAG: hypothetical protein WC325_08130 [Candidatus Bathyarchaeia archaeon]